MIYCFDIDGTICTNTEGFYESAIPFRERITYINQLYEDGHTIKMFTARGSGTGKDWRQLTEKQLQTWGVKYNELILGKPEADLFIDDKAINDVNYFFPDNIIIRSHILAVQNTFDNVFIDRLLQFSKFIFDKWTQGGKLLIAGNGGSFSDAQHFSAELTGRFINERKPLASVVLGSNNSSISAIANDYSYDYTFARELQALAAKDDVLVCFSTSGISANIVEAAKMANKIGIPCFLFSSLKAPKDSLDLWSDYFLASSKYTPSIQELHIMMIHVVCNEIDEYSK